MGSRPRVPNVPCAEQCLEQRSWAALAHHCVHASNKPWARCSAHCWATSTSRGTGWPRAAQTGQGAAASRPKATASSPAMALSPGRGGCGAGHQAPAGNLCALEQGAHRAERSSDRNPTRCAVAGSDRCTSTAMPSATLHTRPPRGSGADSGGGTAAWGPAGAGAASHVLGTSWPTETGGV